MFMFLESLVLVVESVKVLSGVVCCIGKFCSYQMLSLW